MYTYQRFLFGGMSKMRRIPPSCRRIHLSTRYPSDAQSPDVLGFKAMYPTILNDVTTDSELNRKIPYAVKRITEILNYNMENVDVYLMIAVVSSYRAFAATPPSEEDMKLAYIMAWCAELARTSIIMVDDVLDNSPVRRNRPSWYRAIGDNGGPVAIRDALIVDQCLYSIMKTHFHDKFYYWDTVETQSQILYATALGQVTDLQVMADKKNLDNFTVDQFHNLVRYKTCHETWYGWITLGVQMNIASREMRERIDRVVFPITFQMAILSQMLDDYMDCYGTKKGHFGNDIQCGQLTFLMCMAVKMVNPKQRSILEECYGAPGKDNIQAVMNVYDELGLKELFKQYYGDGLRDLQKTIDQVPEYIPKEIFTNAFDRVFYNRI